MFANLSTAYKIATNLANIKEIVATIYAVVVKTTNVVNYIAAQTNNTKFGKLVAQYVPTVATILNKIKAVIEKYGKIIGIDTGNIVVAQSSDHEKDLKDALASLNDLLK